MQKLLANNRFWILAVGVVLSINIAGFVQLLVPGGSLQIIRTEQFYGFMSLLLLYVALLASPLTKAYPNLPFKGAYLHARRAIGVMSFYYGCLHGYLSFFDQLGGFGGIKYYNQKYALSIACGTFTLAILFVMTVTSLDWAVKIMGFKNWKLLHRLVYLASVALMLHIILLGPHYAGLGFVSTLTAVATVLLLWLESQRFWTSLGRKGGKRA